MAGLPYVPPLRRPNFLTTEQMRNWVEGLKPYARTMPAADRALYQGVRKSLNNRDSKERKKADPQTGKAFLKLLAEKSQVSLGPKFIFKLY